jgi:hypothetical protein
MCFTVMFLCMNTIYFAQMGPQIPNSTSLVLLCAPFLYNASLFSAPMSLCEPESTYESKHAVVVLLFLPYFC